jgi:hypothetical protein
MLSRGPLGRVPNRLLVAGLLAPVSWLLAGCSSSGGDLISTVALPSQQSVAAAESDGFEISPPQDGGRMAGVPNLTDSQRGYLDDLMAAGVHPANDLRALSIGAYVCQARAAGQSDQAVWDSVAPMVRSDMTTTHGLEAPEVSYLDDVDATIGNYIGIATKRLC